MVRARRSTSPMLQAPRAAQTITIDGANATVYQPVVVTTPVGPIVTISGQDGAGNGSTAATITFTADNSGDSGVATPVAYQYQDAEGNLQTGSVDLTDRQTWSFTIGYDAAVDTGRQDFDVTTDVAGEVKVSVYAPAPPPQDVVTPYGGPVSINEGTRLYRQRGRHQQSGL